jgi:tRNA (mo5U34)-methyltransferase
MTAENRKREVEGLDGDLQARGRDSRWERYRLPVELEGRSFLDVGCWEGVHCADAVRHGSSDVLGVDLCTGGMLRENVERYGFDFLQMDVFGEHFLGLGTFDVVLCSGLLPSVQSPALLLNRLRRVTSELLVLETTTTTWGDDRPMMLFQGGGEGTTDKSNWWAPNKRCLTEMLEATGFEGISVVWEDERREGFGRACVHAVPSGSPDRRRLQPRKPKQMSIRGGNRPENPKPAAGRFPEGDPRNEG